METLRVKEEIVLEEKQATLSGTLIFNQFVGPETRTAGSKQADHPTDRPPDSRAQVRR